jgi:hypothetical protein
MKKKVKVSIIDVFLWECKQDIEVKPINIAPIDHKEFVLWFLDKNKGIIRRHINRRLIPNRYTPEDVQSYMIERMLDILKKREAKGKPIEDPKVYFRKLIDFWCIEYQRMYGYIYGLPKRPRCTEAEEDISYYGFVYLKVKESGSDDEYASTSHIDKLGYVDSSSFNEFHQSDYRVVGEEPDEHTEAWESLMKMALPEDRDVLTYLFRYNLSVPEISKELKIAVSTAYQRRDRGLRAISGTLASFIDLDQQSWKILEKTSSLDPALIDVTKFYNLD